MLMLDSVRKLLGLHVPAAVGPETPIAETPVRSLIPDAALAEDDDPQWSSARISVAEALWGEGFLFPGGRTEIMRLAKPLGLSAASSLLLIGAGTGGAARQIAAELGVWVTGYETNARLAALANERSFCAGLGRRAQVEPWDPQTPRFPPHYFHHGIAIEPMRAAAAEPLLTAVERALKPGGQLVLVDTVADQPLMLDDPMVVTWAGLEHRSAEVISEAAITDVLTQLGFDVRIVEDVSRRHMDQALQGWSAAVHAMQGTHPTLRQVAVVVREAELWLARLRLMRTHHLRLVRWHAISAG